MPHAPGLLQGPAAYRDYAMLCHAVPAVLLPCAQDLIPEDEYEYESEGDNLKDVRFDDKSEASLI